jgi:hypothetical protein
MLRRSFLARGTAAALSLLFPALRPGRTQAAPMFAPVPKVVKSSLRFCMVFQHRPGYRPLGVITVGMVKFAEHVTEAQAWTWIDQKVRKEPGSDREVLRLTIDGNRLEFTMMDRRS